MLFNLDVSFIVNFTFQIKRVCHDDKTMTWAYFLWYDLRLLSIITGMSTKVWANTRGVLIFFRKSKSLFIDVYLFRQLTKICNKYCEQILNSQIKCATISTLQCWRSLGLFFSPFPNFPKILASFSTDLDQVALDHLGIVWPIRCHHC